MAARVLLHRDEISRADPESAALDAVVWVVTILRQHRHGRGRARRGGPTPDRPVEVEHAAVPERGEGDRGHRLRGAGEAETGGSFRGTAELDGAPTTAGLTLEQTDGRLHGTLQLGTLPLPVDPEALFLDGWCDVGQPVLLLGLGPSWGLLPLALEPADPGWRANLALQGGHRLALSLVR